MLEEWKDARDVFMDEILRRRGRRGVPLPSLCPRCETDGGTLRCCECVGSELYCASCMCEMHAHMPLHKVEVRLVSILLIVAQS